MALGPGEEMLPVPEGATKGNLSGEIDKLLADELKDSNKQVLRLISRPNYRRCPGIYDTRNLHYPAREAPANIIWSVVKWLILASPYPAREIRISRTCYQIS